MAEQQPAPAPATAPAASEQPQPQQQKQAPAKKEKKPQQPQQKKEKKPQPQQQQHQELPPPPFWGGRVEVFEKLFAEQKAEYEKLPKTPIEVKLPSGDIFQGTAHVTTPLEILKATQSGTAFPKGTLETGVIARIDGKNLWDLTRPLEANCALEVLSFETEEGQHVFWHSSAHILGQALEKKYHALLNVGPPTEKDFFYDVKLDEAHPISDTDFKDLEKVIAAIVKAKQPFQRIEATPDQAAQLFQYNPYKLEIIHKTPATEKITVYRCGNLVDLCRGPHIPNTGLPKGFIVKSTCSVFSEGKANSDPLHRVYAISFPSKQQLKDYEERIRQAELRDHRNIGKQQELFFFHPYSAGSCFFLPHGYRLYLTLTQFIQEEYHKRGYDEVLTPNIFMSKLWETSGHWSHYQKNMFVLHCDDVDWALKPMNCPGHCLMFANRVRSYRELPIRYAEFGVLHRNEVAGALHGLTRVRRFQQDDSHIFCRTDQIRQEVSGVFEFIKFVYATFNFNLRLELSTRPADFMGEISLWEQAEAELSSVLTASGMPFRVNAGDGAFYGPKIDVHIQDALGRDHQCATIQLDFQLPIKFDLQYMSAETGKWDRPVMVHRAILGSLERFIGILTEHTAGKWPFWLSPRQIVVIPVSVKHAAYAAEVASAFHGAHFFVDVDDSDKLLQKKIREAQVAQYNYILVVGQEEVDTRTVNVRTRENVVRGKATVAELLSEFEALRKDHK